LQDLNGLGLVRNSIASWLTRRGRSPARLALVPFPGLLIISNQAGELKKSGTGKTRRDAARTGSAPDHSSYFDEASHQILQNARKARRKSIEQFTKATARNLRKTKELASSNLSAGRRKRSEMDSDHQGDLHSGANSIKQMGRIVKPPSDSGGKTVDGKVLSDRVPTVFETGLRIRNIHSASPSPKPSHALHGRGRVM